MTLQDWLTEADADGQQLPALPRPRRWVLAAVVALAVVLVAVGIGALELRATPRAAPSPGSTSVAPSSPAPAPAGTPLVVAVLHDPGAPALPIQPLTMAAREVVLGEVPERVPNFDTCSADGAALAYLPVEIRSPELWLAGTVEVRTTASTPPGIGRLGFFFQAGEAATPCPEGRWSTSDRFQASNYGQDVITGYVVLDSAAASTARDVIRTLRLRISSLEVNGRPALISPPTVGALCPQARDAVCAPLG